ncbi:MAG: malonyl-ACP O-methyltransferase BioC [Halioglobus sp.]|nr:malonyl-ACP O-methyltransferase BioC [Halioglobus sp.]
MRLATEYLPATRAARQHLVLLHGWGANREIWRPLLVHLRPWADITLVDIPGCAPGLAPSQQPELDAVLAALSACTAGPAVYVGWSLGGQLAIELALRDSARVSAVITICSNPRFVATDTWPGMSGEVFDGFCASAVADPAAALRRFDGLQVAGATRPRALLRQLHSQCRGDGGPGLLAGLDWLRQLDHRAHLPALARSQLHLLAQRDTLVPAAVAPALRALLRAASGAQVIELPACSHVAPLECAPELAARAREFLQRSELLEKTPVKPAARAKQEVADSFSRAAQRYDSAAALQRDVGTQLLENLRHQPLEPARVLDLGCGTGHFFTALDARFPRAQYIGLDLAMGMVIYARGRNGPGGQWLVGDAESLPLAAGSVDLVFSSLALQWCDDLGALFAEIARVLRPGGRCVFATLGPGTLRELRDAWAAVDAYQHVNDFASPAELREIARGVPGLNLSLRVRHYRMQYRRVGELLAELKTLGAHNMNRQRPAGLASRRALQGMLQAYENWRENGRLPASYEVLFGELIKR